jgi:hypothetical protein
MNFDDFFNALPDIPQFELTFKYTPVGSEWLFSWPETAEPGCEFTALKAEAVGRHLRLEGEALADFLKAILKEHPCQQTEI